jgi:ABC-type methionine transport system permease subunit
MGVSFVIGVLLGLACVSFGPVVDTVITRLMDLIMAVPSLVLAILVVAVLGPSLTNTIVAVTIVYLPRYVRLLRASAQAELGKDYVTAARVAGVGKARLMFRTVLPNCLAPLIVQAALGVSDAILEAAALGFLGLGAQPPTAEWGTMLADAREFIRSEPWLVTLPGLAILITVVSINLAGDGLRDALDPKMRKHERAPAGHPRAVGQLRHPPRRLPGRGRRGPERRPQRAAGHRRRIRLGQVGGHAGHHGPAALDGHRHGRAHGFDGQDLLTLTPASAAP